MDIQERPIKEITPYSRNPRKNQASVDLVAGSLKEFGWRQPIVIDETGLIVVGHTRYYAAIQLGMEKVPVHVAEGLSEDQAKAYRIADNKSADESDWDYDLLKIELEEIENKASTGFSDKEIQKLYDEEEPSGRPEVEFSEELLLEHNYVVLYFDNPLDWEVAQDKFGLKLVKDLIPRKGQPVGIGRVLKGGEWLDRIK